MQTAIQEGEGKVALHQWFAGEENWAYHPWFQPQLLALVEALDGELKRGRHELRESGGREVSQPFHGGWLFGEHAPDPTCADPAGQRYPSVLRLVYLTAEPTTRCREALLAQLRTVRAEQPGEEAGLELSRPLERETASATPPRRATRRLVVLGLTALVVATVALVAWALLVPDTDDVKAVQRMKVLLSRWELGQGSNPSDTVARFFKALSTENFGDLSKEKHPDAAFLSRLPARPEKAGKADTWVSQLQKLFKDIDKVGIDGQFSKLARKAENEKKPIGLRTLVDAIEEQMNYEEWWDKHGWKEPYDPSVENKELSDLARRFAKTPDSKDWSIGTAGLMLRELKRWKAVGVTKEDVDKRPRFIVQCYFHLLSQQPIRAALDGTKEKVHQHVRFAEDGLPREPTLKPPFDEATVKDNLKELARCVGVKSPGSTAEALLNQIAQGVDYVAVVGRDQKKGTEGLDERIVQYVERFRNPALRPK